MAVLHAGRIFNPAERNGRIENPSYAISRWLTRPTPGAPSHTPADFGLAHESLESRTSDGQRLVGWIVSPTVAPRATIALFHGIRRNRAQMLDRILFLVAAGYRCVAFDHRAHGESTGTRTSFGFHERHDVLAVARLIQRLWLTQPCAAFGIGMGGAAICYAASGLHGLAAIILESVQFDPAAAMCTWTGGVFPPWSNRLAQSVIEVTAERLGVPMQQLAPGKWLAALAPTPVLFGTDEHAAYNDARSNGDDVYQRRILNFLEKCLCRNDSSAGGFAVAKAVSGISSSADARPARRRGS
jgi:pimeloyl-ACP methyl ester carboxylesterase